MGAFLRSAPRHNLFLHRTHSGLSRIPKIGGLELSIQSNKCLLKLDINPSDICSIGLTGHMHGLVLLNENGQVLRPAILWNDQRTGAECDQIRERIGKDKLIQITGNDALTGFTAPKILWVQNHEPTIYSQIQAYLIAQRLHPLSV